MLRPFFLAIILLALVAAPVMAQDHLAAPRIRVRLTSLPRNVEGFVGPQLVRGTLVRASSDSLWIQLHPETAPLAVSVTGVSRLEVSRGAPSRTRTALIDAAVLGVMGGILSALLEESGNVNRFGSTGRAAVAGAAFGAAYGTVGGALFPREFWRRVRWADLEGLSR